MNYFIIIRGPLGIGKTTIAKKLKKILKAEYISMDEIVDNNMIIKKIMELPVFKNNLFIHGQSFAKPV